MTSYVGSVRAREPGPEAAREVNNTVNFLYMRPFSRGKKQKGHGWTA